MLKPEVWSWAAGGRVGLPFLISGGRNTPDERQSLNSTTQKMSHFLGFFHRMMTSHRVWAVVCFSTAGTMGLLLLRPHGLLRLSALAQSSGLMAGQVCQCLTWLRQGLLHHQHLHTDL